MVVFVLFELALSTVEIPGVLAVDKVRVPFFFEAALWAWIAHLIPPTEFNVVNDVFNTSNKPIKVILVLTNQERIDGLHGLNKT